MDIDGTVLAKTPPQFIPEDQPSPRTESEYERLLEEAEAAERVAEEKFYYPAIPVAKRFVDWLDANDIPYVYVSGRDEKFMDQTCKNLKAEGLYGKHCEGVYLDPEQSWGGEFKQNKFVELGLEKPIWAMIGDDPTDILRARSLKNKSLDFDPPVENGFLLPIII